MDGTTRRRRLGLVAIAIAAFATAATSAAPTPTPALSSIEEGTFAVTADRPVAWLDVAATDNAALRAAGGTTTVRVKGEPDDLGVLLIAGDPTRQDPRSYLGGTEGQAFCAAGEACAATVRLTAILLDPVAHPEVKIAWTATAETRFPEKGGPVPAAELAVAVSAVETRSADTVGLALTKPETIELGPDLPLTVRAVHVTLPAGPVPDSALRPAVLLLTTDHGDGTRYNPPVTIQVVQDGKVIGSDWSFSHLSPFVDCAPGAACEVDLDIEFSWNGGTAAGSAIDWSLAAWPGVSTGESTPNAGIVVSHPPEISWVQPPLTASETGQSNVTAPGAGRVHVSAELDLQRAQTAPKTEGLVRLTFRAALAAGSDPKAEIGIRVGEALDTALLRPGEEVVVYSGAETIVCNRLSTCRFTFFVEVSRNAKVTPEATIDWTAEVEFVPLAEGGGLEAANLWIDVTSPPQ